MSDAAPGVVANDYEKTFTTTPPNKKFKDNGAIVPEFAVTKNIDKAKKEKHTRKVDRFVKKLPPKGGRRYWRALDHNLPPGTGHFFGLF